MFLSFCAPIFSSKTCFDQYHCTCTSCNVLQGQIFWDKLVLLYPIEEVEQCQSQILSSTTWLKISLIIATGSLVLLFFRFFSTFSSSSSFQGDDLFEISSSSLDYQSSVFKQKMSISSGFIGLSLNLNLHVLR